MSRFATPQEVIEWADKAALGDYQRHTMFGSGLNPYCTPGARADWRRGFNNLGPRSYESSVEFDTMYQRGRAMARLIQEEARDEAR